MDKKVYFKYHSFVDGQSISKGKCAEVLHFRANGDLLVEYLGDDGEIYQRWIPFGSYQEDPLKLDNRDKDSVWTHSHPDGSISGSV